VGFGPLLFDLFDQRDLFGERVTNAVRIFISKLIPQHLIKGAYRVLHDSDTAPIPHAGRRGYCKGATVAAYRRMLDPGSGKLASFRATSF
jgi:hypothetical protein